jgi:hypothetical protein
MNKLSKKLKILLFKWIELPLKKLQTLGSISLTPIQVNILQNLRKDGIAVTSFQELFGETSLLNVINEFTSFYNDETVKKIRLEEQDGQSKNNLSYKNYNIRATAINPILSHHSVLIQNGLSAVLGNMASAYFKEQALLRYADYWISIPKSTEDRNFSQNWHRDPEDKQILKVFIYLNDVTDKNGAFEYVKGSHHEGKYGNVFPFNKKLYNNYTEETALKELIPEQDFVTNEGLKGTIIICDTNGFHRGGYCKIGERWMMTYMYNRASLIMSNQFKIDHISKLTKSQKIFYATFG